MSNGYGAAFTAVLALSVAMAAPQVSAKQPAGSVVLTPAADIKWADVQGFPGVQLAAVDGNPGKGPHHSMLKFAGGFSAPIHHHSSDHHGIVVAGTLVLVVDGKEHKLPPGSYFAFKHRAKHATRCEAGADCVLALDTRGKWDVIAADAKAAGKK